MYRSPRATDSSMLPASSGRHAGSNEECSEATAAAGWRSRKTNRASGQQAAIRSQTSTLLGVLTTSRGLPLRRSASASTRSQSMCSRSSVVSSSPSREAWIHCVSARTPRCLSGSSGGAYSSEWLPRMTRSSVEPDRGAEKTNTGAVSSRPPSACGQVPRPAREGTGQLIPGDSHQHRVEQLRWRNPPGPVRQRAGELIPDGALEYRVDPLLAVHALPSCRTGTVLAVHPEATRHGSLPWSP